MAQVLVEKQVLFCGIWRPRPQAFLDDAFLRTVGTQFEAKPGATAKWRLTTVGLTIIVTRSESGKLGQTDQIPVQSLLETTVNRYNPYCLMTTYLDVGKRFSVIVCRCESTQDARTIVDVFQRLRQSFSGQGYAVDIRRGQGTNWMLKTKGKEGGQEKTGPEPLNAGVKNQDGTNGYSGTPSKTTCVSHVSPVRTVLVATEAEKLEREATQVGGRPCFNVGVQTEVREDEPDDLSDRESIASDVSYQSMQDEIASLSSEVRDLKLLLEQTTGISAEELFKRYRGSSDAAPRLMPVKRLLSTESTESATELEKKVKFAAPPDEEDGLDRDFDMRSIGMQAGGNSRLKYAKRMRKAAAAPARYQLHPVHRQRAGSASSGSSSPHTHPPRPAAAANGSWTARPESPVGARPLALDARSQDPRCGDDSGPGSLSRASWLSGSGTVVRSIEAVYHHPHASIVRRRPMGAVPTRSVSMPRNRRPFAQSGAESSSPGARAHADTADPPPPRTTQPAAPQASSRGVGVGTSERGEAMVTESS